MSVLLRTVAGVDKLRIKFPGENNFVFKDLSLTVERGEKLLLLGPSGCGKSTLLQVLAGIIPELIEVPMKCSGHTVPPSWGMLFQDPDTQFCMPYVDEELAFVLENRSIPKEEMPAKIEEVLRQVGLDLKQPHYPIASLSQGMKQRLALASILLMDPEVLLLDEPSALLDPEGRKQIWEAVRQTAGQRTLIIVEHRTEELLQQGLVDRVILFDPDGKVLGDGPPDELFVRHQRELEQYGIWHPGVWEKYRTVGTRGHSSDRLNEGEPIIHLKDFQGLRQGRPVIHVDHAEVFPGDFIAITGPNGAGKSSFLLSLMGLLPSKGEYLLGGKSIDGSKVRKRNIEAISKSMGFVFQNPEFQFIENQVEREISYSMVEEGMSSEEIQRRTETALNQFGLAGLGHRHPYQLSLGQKRRLSVAGSAVMEKSVLLLDEPTFGQDAVNTFAILELCKELCRKGITIMMVTHEEMIADGIASRKWEIRDGRLTE